MHLVLRPEDLYDREREWNDLARFAAAERPRLRLGVLYGRRRFGKSFLLRRLVRQAGGLYHLALEQEPAPALRHFARSVASLHEPEPPLSFSDWDQGLRYLLQRLGSRQGGHVVVLDEYPYLRAASPELDSVLQALMDDAAGGSLTREWTGSVSLILCGSALSVMTDILSGTSPLRGRATLELALAAFDFRQARAYWGIEDRDVAFAVDAVLGGAPGYRDLTGAQEVPASTAELVGWLAGNVLNPAHALYREDAYLLREDPRVTRHSLYYSILNAVAGGATAPSEIAARIGKKATDLDHPLGVLLSAGFLRRHDDFLLQRRPTYAVADPVVRFHELVTRRHEAQAEERQVDALWQGAEPTFRARILGPHFEDMARMWTARYAAGETLGGPIGPVAPLQLHDRQEGRSFEIDVAAATRGSASRREKTIQILGEVKATAAPVPLGALEHLDHHRSLLEKKGVRFSPTARMLLFSRSGFGQELVERAGGRRDAVLVDLERLYEGS